MSAITTHPVTVADDICAQESDSLAILHHSTLNLAKQWLAGGAVKPYDKPKNFRLESVGVANINELSALLTRLEGNPHACLIRGRYVGEALAKERTPVADLKRGYVLRQKIQFEDQALHTVLIEVDEFEPITADPIADPQVSIEEYITSELPSAFHCTSYHWQLSNSAGHPTKAGKLKVHVWFWLSTPRTSGEIKEWAAAVGLAADSSVFDPIQIHYTAAPVFEQGVADPVPLRSGFVQGLCGDEVDLDVAPAILAAAAEKAQRKQRDPLELVNVHDEVAQFLHANWEVRGTTSNGKGLHIRCPNDAEHTSDTEPSSSTYFLAGTGGFAQGHFVCKHDHCKHLNGLDGQHAFQKAIGYDQAQFDPLPVKADERPPLPNFARNKSGEILSTDDNVTKALRRPDVCGFRIGFDSFRDELMLAPEGTDEWRPFTDADYTRISIVLERGSFKTTSSDRLRSCVRLVAEERRFDSAMVWLRSLEWDQTPRIERFLATHARAEDSAYIRAVSLYLFTALAGRVLEPGCKADMVPVLVGPQGAGKSSAIAALVPAPEHFVEISFHEEESTLARKMRGRLVGEIAELRGLKTKELEAIKAFITRTHENWVPKWQEFAKTFPRRLVFVGTTNADEFLADETGNRRWLPVRVGRIDVEAIRRDSLQLWAEARERFTSEGILFRGAEQLSGEAHAAHTITDTWETAISRWLATPTTELIGEGDTNEANGARPFRVGDVLDGALALSSKEQDMAKAHRVGKVLRKLGYSDKQMTVDGVRAKFWTKTEGR